MKSLLYTLTGFLMIGAIFGLWVIASGVPIQKPLTTQEQLDRATDEVARLRQDIKYRDAVIARQAEIIAGYRK